MEAVPACIPSVKTAKDDNPVSRALNAMNQKRMPSNTNKPLRSGLAKTTFKLSRTLVLPSFTSVFICSGSSTKINTITNATTMTVAPATNGATRPNELNKMPPPKYASRPPTPPIRLIIPFALLRSSGSKRSPSQATVGERNNAIPKFVIRMKAAIARTVCATGIKTKPSNAMGAPARIQGLRLPKRFHVWSLFAPTHGWINILMMLSQVMMNNARLGASPKPVISGIERPSLNNCLSNSGLPAWRKIGINWLNIGHTMLIPRNPNPSKKVFP